MRTFFMGTPDFAVPSLERVAETTDLTLVVTRPDAVRSRGRKLEPSPVKARALELGLEVVEASRVDDALVERIGSLSCDLGVVAAFGCLLPDALLDAARLGCVNVHASSLPRWRGAAPIQRAILAGDERAGVSIMRVVHDLDAGAYCRQADVDCSGLSSAQLLDELARLGADELAAALPTIADGTAQWVEQDESLVTYAKKIRKDEVLLDPDFSAEKNARLVRASGDTAPSRCVVSGRALRVLAAEPDPSVEVERARVLVRKGRIWLGCSEGALRLEQVKPDGKRAMAAQAFAAGIAGKDDSWARV